jgi:hypothetical protein
MEKINWTDYLKYKEALQSIMEEWNALQRVYYKTNGRLARLVTSCVVGPTAF